MISDEERQLWYDAAERVTTAVTDRFVARFARAGHEVSSSGRSAIRATAHMMPRPVTDALYAEIDAALDRCEGGR